MYLCTPSKGELNEQCSNCVDNVQQHFSCFTCFLTVHGCYILYWFIFKKIISDKDLDRNRISIWSQVKRWSDAQGSSSHKRAQKNKVFPVGEGYGEGLYFTYAWTLDYIFCCKQYESSFNQFDVALKCDAPVLSTTAQVSRRGNSTPISPKPLNRCPLKLAWVMTSETLDLSCFGLCFSLDLAAVL